MTTHNCQEHLRGIGGGDMSCSICERFFSSEVLSGEYNPYRKEIQQDDLKVIIKLIKEIKDILKERK